jgi:hypothetical protein
MAKAATKRLKPDPVPLAPQVDDWVYLRTRVRIHRKNFDGTFTVVGDGINRTVPARDILPLPAASQ